MSEVEGILIQVLEPKLNKQGPGWRDTASEYVQQGRPAEADQVSDMADAIKAMQEQLHMISEQLSAFSRKKPL